jgi:hypothetical protein
MAWATPFKNILSTALPTYAAAKGREQKATVVSNTVQLILKAHEASGSSKSLPAKLPKVILFSFSQFPFF